MSPAVRRWWMALASLAFVWTIGNAIYVYAVLDGARLFRLESASFILVIVILPLVFGRVTESVRSDVTASAGRALVLLASILWLLTLSPFLTLPFLSDDYVFLATYRRWSDVLNVAQFFRPMFAAVFLLLAKVGRGSPVPFHLTALAIHAASAGCVYTLSARLFRRADAAAIAAAIFLLNPLQLEPVLWPSGLQELLWTAFVLAALVVYTGSATLSPARLAATLLLVACALLSKETAISSVLLFPAADWALFRMRRGGLLPAAYAGVAILAVAYLLVRARVASIGTGFLVAPDRYFAQKFLATPYKFFVQPLNTTAASLSPLVLCGVTVAFLAVLFAAAARGTAPSILVGPIVILISTLPVYAYFYVAPDLRATRYLYFASVGWGLLMAHLLTAVFVRAWIRVAAAAAVLVLSFLALSINARPWRTSGEIVNLIAATLRDGNVAEMSADEWTSRYGNGIEVKDGVPIVYRGVYLFVNGYPELRQMSHPSSR